MLDLTGQPWHTMESMACARSRLLAEQGEFAAAESLVSSLCATASEYGLVRTLLRGLALSIAAAEAPGRPDRSSEPLVEFLRLARDSDYIRPLARHRDASRAALRRLLETGPDAETREAAESMLTRLDRQKPEEPVFSPREIGTHGRRLRDLALLLSVC